jgi:hypothetical protein
MVIKACSIRGTAVYYTGKIGEELVSANIEHAARYAVPRDAERVVRRLQRQHPRLTWMTDYRYPEDAHAAGAAAMSQEMCG